MRFQERLRGTLTRSESRLLEKLNTPHKIQDYLDDLAINFELHGETCMSPRRVIESGRAHCIEAAFFAAAALAYHGRKPLLLDLQTTPEDEDHVVALFQDGGYWGSISKTNHVVLRWRDPIYASVRELSITYFHEYFMGKNGKKTLRHHSKPFDLSRHAPEKWVTASGELFWLAEELDDSPHFPLVPPTQVKRLRRATPFERTGMDQTEWDRKGRRNKKRQKSF